MPGSPEASSCPDTLLAPIQAGGAVLIEPRRLAWRTVDGVKIRAYEWPSEGEARGLVLIVHGLGSHARRFDHVARALADGGLTTIVMDRRGHGRSGGQRGHTPSYDTLMDDMDQYLGEGTRAHEGLPVFLYGHSQGGNLVINHLLRRRPRVKGAVVTSPWIRLASPPSPVTMVLGRALARIHPTFTKSKWLDTSLLSRDPAQVKRYESDPMVHYSITLSMFYGCYDAGLWSLENARLLNVPMLLMHGDSDGVTEPMASREFARRAGDLCTFRMWKGGYHELHNDLEKDRVVRAVVYWFTGQLSARGKGSKRRL